MKWPRAGQHLIEHNAHRPHVGSVVDIATDRLLGAHIRNRAEHDVSVRDRDVFNFGHAKVENLRPSVGEEHDIRRLHVAMDDAMLVSLLQSARDLESNRDGVFTRQRTAHETRLQRLAVVERHRDEQLSFGCFADLVDRADVGVIERRRSAGLVQEAALRIWSHAKVRRKKLQGDVSTEPLVERSVDHAHRP